MEWAWQSSGESYSSSTPTGPGPSLIGMCSVRLQLSTTTLMSETKSSFQGVIPKAMRPASELA